MKKILSLMMVLALLLAAAVPAYADVMDARNSVVRIYAELYNPATGETAYSVGCGVAVGEQGKPVEYFVTSTQAIAPDGYQPIIIYIVLVDEMSMQLASIKAQSVEKDFTVLEIAEPASERQAVTFRSFDWEEAREAILGESVYTIGFPVLSANALIAGSGAALPSTVYDQTITSGIVTRIIENDADSNGEQIQHTAAIGGGSNGSALVDEEGRLLGVNFAGDDNGGYAISSNEILRFLEEAGIPVGAGQEDNQPRGKKTPL